MELAFVRCALSVVSSLSPEALLQLTGVYVSNSAAAEAKITRPRSSLHLRGKLQKSMYRAIF